MSDSETKNQPDNAETKASEEVFTGKVDLVSSDGSAFEVAKQVAAQSELVKVMLKPAQDEEEDDEDSEGENETKQEIPLPNVDAATLSKIVEFLNYHHHNGPSREIEKPLHSYNLCEVVDEWDANFIDIEHERLFELIVAANYMDIKSLLDLGCAKVATLIKGKSPEDIRRTFNIVNDFTPEEEARIREENRWCGEG